MVTSSNPAFPLAVLAAAPLTSAGVGTRPNPLPRIHLGPPPEPRWSALGAHRVRARTMLCQRESRPSPSPDNGNLVQVQPPWYAACRRPTHSLALGDCTSRRRAQYTRTPYHILGRRILSTSLLVAIPALHSPSPSLSHTRSPSSPIFTLVRTCSAEFSTSTANRHMV